jgi:transposase
MNVFLEELNKVNNGQKMVIIMDGAGWHKSEKLIIPNDTRTIILPPYSPELNPTEKLWQYIKDLTLLRTEFIKLFVNWRMWFANSLEH